MKNNEDRFSKFTFLPFLRQFFWVFCHFFVFYWQFQPFHYIGQWHFNKVNIFRHNFLSQKFTFWGGGGGGRPYKKKKIAQNLFAHVSDENKTFVKKKKMFFFEKIFIPSKKIISACFRSRPTSKARAPVWNANFLLYWIWNLSKHWTNLKNNEDLFSKFAFLPFLRQFLYFSFFFMTISAISSHRTMKFWQSEYF